MTKQLKTLDDLYQYLDTLYDEDASTVKADTDNMSVEFIDDIKTEMKTLSFEDTLFASGYLRGFISLASTAFGGDEQLISADLVESISEKLLKAKSELSPQDFVIVQNFWIKVQSYMVVL
jgi:hypothetical protein